jgi:hypothetical protein
MRLGKGAKAAAILRNRLTFWQSHPSKGQSRNIQGTDKGNYYALKSCIPLIKRELTLTGSYKYPRLSEKTPSKKCMLRMEILGISPQVN